MKKTKTIMAIIYIIGATIVMFVAMAAGFQMWVSGTFLAGKYITRKILYLLLLGVIVIAGWFFNEGIEYLNTIRK